MGCFCSFGVCLPKPHPSVPEARSCMSGDTTPFGVSIVEGSEGGGAEAGALSLREASVDSTERTEDEMISRAFRSQSRVLLTPDGEENCRDTRSHAKRNRLSQENKRTRALGSEVWRR